MDDEQGFVSQRSDVKNPTWCGREVQWCRARDLQVGDQLIAPPGESSITDIVFQYNIGSGLTIVTCTPMTGDDFTIELELNQPVMRLEQGGSQKMLLVRSVHAGDVSDDDWVYTGGNRCYKVMSTTTISGVTATVLDPEVRLVDGDLLASARPLDLNGMGQSLSMLPGTGYLLLVGPASSSVSIIDEEVAA